MATWIRRDLDEPIETHNFSLITHDISGTQPNKFKMPSTFSRPVGNLYRHTPFADTQAVRRAPQERDSLDELRASQQLTNQTQDRQSVPTGFLQKSVDFSNGTANLFQQPSVEDKRNYSQAESKPFHQRAARQPFVAPVENAPRGKEHVNEQGERWPKPEFERKGMYEGVDKWQVRSSQLKNSDPREEYIANLYKRYTTPHMDYRALHPAFLKLPAVSAKYLHSEYQENFVPNEAQATQEVLQEKAAHPWPDSRIASAASVRLLSGYNIAHSEYELNRKHTRAEKNPDQLVFESEQLIPQRFRNDPHYHIVRAPDGRFHVYDMTRWNHKIIYDQGRVVNDYPTMGTRDLGKLDALNHDYEAFARPQR